MPHIDAQFGPTCASQSLTVQPAEPTFDLNRKVKKPEAAQALTALLAAGEHVEVLSSCPACRGSYTAVIKRTLVPRVSRACMFCNSSQVSVLVVDPQEESQMT